MSAKALEDIEKKIKDIKNKEKHENKTPSKTPSNVAKKVKITVGTILTLKGLFSTYRFYSKVKYNFNNPAGFVDDFKSFIESTTKAIERSKNVLNTADNIAKGAWNNYVDMEFMLKDVKKSLKKRLDYFVSKGHLVREEAVKINDELLSHIKVGGEKINELGEKIYVKTTVNSEDILNNQIQILDDETDGQLSNFIRSKSIKSDADFIKTNKEEVEEFLKRGNFKASRLPNSPALTLENSEKMAKAKTVRVARLKYNNIDKFKKPKEIFNKLQTYEEPLPQNFNYASPDNTPIARMLRKQKGQLTIEDEIYYAKQELPELTEEQLTRFNNAMKEIPDGDFMTESDFNNFRKTAHDIDIVKSDGSIISDADSFKTAFSTDESESLKSFGSAIEGELPDDMLSGKELKTKYSHYFEKWGGETDEALRTVEKWSDNIDYYASQMFDEFDLHPNFYKLSKSSNPKISKFFSKVLEEIDGTDYKKYYEPVEDHLSAGDLRKKHNVPDPFDGDEEYKEIDGKRYYSADEIANREVVVEPPKQFTADMLEKEVENPIKVGIEKLEGKIAGLGERTAAGIISATEKVKNLTAGIRATISTAEEAVSGTIRTGLERVIGESVAGTVMAGGSAIARTSVAFAGVYLVFQIPFVKKATDSVLKWMLKGYTDNLVEKQIKFDNDEQEYHNKLTVMKDASQRAKRLADLGYITVKKETLYGNGSRTNEKIVHENWYDDYKRVKTDKGEGELKFAPTEGALYHGFLLSADKKDLKVPYPNPGHTLEYVGEKVADIYVPDYSNSKNWKISPEELKALSGVVIDKDNTNRKWGGSTYEGKWTQAKVKWGINDDLFNKAFSANGKNKENTGMKYIYSEYSKRGIHQPGNNKIAFEYWVGNRLVRLYDDKSIWVSGNGKWKLYQRNDDMNGDEWIKHLRDYKKSVGGKIAFDNMAKEGAYEKESKAERDNIKEIFGDILHIKEIEYNYGKMMKDHLAGVDKISYMTIQNDGTYKNLTDQEWHTITKADTHIHRWQIPTQSSRVYGRIISRVERVESQTGKKYYYIMTEKGYVLQTRPAFNASPSDIPYMIKTIGSDTLINNDTLKNHEHEYEQYKDLFKTKRYENYQKGIIQKDRPYYKKAYWGSEPLIEFRKGDTYYRHNKDGQSWKQKKGGEWVMIGNKYSELMNMAFGGDSSNENGRRNLMVKAVDSADDVEIISNMTTMGKQILPSKNPHYAQMMVDGAGRVIHDDASIAEKTIVPHKIPEKTYEPFHKENVIGDLHTPEGRVVYTLDNGKQSRYFLPHDEDNWKVISNKTTNISQRLSFMKSYVRDKQNSDKIWEKPSDAIEKARHFNGKYINDDLKIVEREKGREEDGSKSIAIKEDGSKEDGSKAIAKGKVEGSDFVGRTPDIEIPHKTMDLEEQQMKREENVEQSYSSGVGVFGSSGINSYIEGESLGWGDFISNLWVNVQSHLIGVFVGVACGQLLNWNAARVLQSSTKNMVMARHFVGGRDNIENSIFAGVVQDVPEGVLTAVQQGRFSSSSSSNKKNWGDFLHRRVGINTGLRASQRGGGRGVLSTHFRGVITLTQYLTNQFNNHKEKYLEPVFVLGLLGLIVGDLFSGIMGKSSITKNVMPLADVADIGKAKFVMALIKNFSGDVKDITTYIQLGLYMFRNMPKDKKDWKQFVDDVFIKHEGIFGKKLTEQFTGEDVDTMNVFSGNNFDFLRDERKLREELYKLGSDNGSNAIEYTFRSFLKSLGASRIDIKDNTSWMGKYFKDYTISVEGGNYNSLLGTHIIGAVELPFDYLLKERQERNLIAEHFAGKNFRYGEYGGRGNEIDSNGEAIGFSGGKTPVDKLDAIFKQHDEDYHSMGDFSKVADRKMIDSIDGLLASKNHGLNKEAIEKAKAIKWYFGNVEIS